MNNGEKIKWDDNQILWNNNPYKWDDVVLLKQVYGGGFDSDRKRYERYKDLNKKDKKRIIKVIMDYQGNEYKDEIEEKDFKIFANDIKETIKKITLEIKVHV